VRTALNQHDTADSEISRLQVRAISDYITRGIEHGCGECIGLELEHFIVTKTDQTYVPYLDDPLTGRTGVQTVLERLRPFYDEPTYEPQPDGSLALLGLSREFAAVSLEPGAQFEISLGPVLEICDLDLMYQIFREELDPILDDLGFELIELGYHPSICARDIPLLPKYRYRFMDEYFKGTGQHGICMMRATASTQVSIDYESEEDALLKFKVANALTPLLAFITDNSPLFELEPIGSNDLSASGLPVPERMVRTAVWNDVDAFRSMVAPGTFDAGFSFDAYASNALEAPAIFSAERDIQGAKTYVEQVGRTVAEVYRKKTLDRADIELILSLYFFDVRFKTYIEIRAADSLPIEYALSYAALIKGLFYNREAMRELALGFAELSVDDVAAAKDELGRLGFEAVVYGRKAQDWLDELLAMATDSLSDSERVYLEPLSGLIAARRTLVDRL